MGLEERRALDVRDRSRLACARAERYRRRTPSGRFRNAKPAAVAHVVVTAEEIGRIAVFTDIEPAERERLSRVASDIALAIAGTRRARSSGASSIATRSGSDGSSRTCRPTRRSGQADCRPRPTSRRHLGFPSGEAPASRALHQAHRLGAGILVTRSITRIDAATRQVDLDGGDILRTREQP